MLEVGKNSFQKEVISSDKLVLVDLYATWCGPCKALAPILEDLEKKYDGKVKAVKINVDEEESLAVKLGVISVPTVVFYKNGKTVASFVGVRSASEIGKIIEKNL
ncbi:MAG: thioredoxin [Clostridiales bacterium]|nr:thioredoxin [Clostridiales bacterium]MDY4654860.1 thioredoxin [Eubacteriales bacterium]